MNIDKAAKYGIDYTKVLLEKINNPFWWTVVESINSFFNLYYNYHTQEPICSQSLWFNPLIHFEYVSRWDNGGVRIVADLINSQFQFQSKQELLDDFNINLNFIDYARPNRSIPHEWSHKTTCMTLIYKKHGHNQFLI